MSDVTHILSAIDQGDPGAAEQLLPLVYGELRRLAAQKLAQEKPGQTLQATALVHEAYLRLVGSQSHQPYRDRRHFFATAATAMRRILVDTARAKQTQKRGGEHQRVSLQDVAAPLPDEELLALHQALDKLAVEDPQKAQLVELRYFGGLTGDQAADVLGISPRVQPIDTGRLPELGYRPKSAANDPKKPRVLCEAGEPKISLTLMEAVMGLGRAAMKEEGIFHEALERPADQRAAYLDDACGDDDALRQRVEVLLMAHANPGSFLQTPAAALFCSTGHAAAEELGTAIGRFKLLQQIGEGGMGVVYMAQQQEPVRRKVALKIIKLGMDTKQVIRRFEAERQALAVMDHPNIAKILDAGATESGRPYFVMDYVRGIPVTEYCDQNEQTTKERLGIFLDVCSAVQHAHQKGIIHRDLKPGNVLVTQHDGKPMPKIIDFGIAKATEQRLTEKTHFTEHRQLVGTPEYMSPEQATFCDADVDTRSDIYSLGVLLYELLVGTTPFDAQALRNCGYEEICRVIRESDAPTPSKRLSTLGEAASEISQHRHVEPAALRKLLRGDLDWIVMKCLEKDRSRRYETVHTLARDIERHLSDEPVLARPPSAAYRLRKLLRKHRAAAAATLAVLATLMIGLALMAIGFARAKHAEGVAVAQRDRAEDNLRLAQELVDYVIRPAAEQMTDLPFTRDTQREVLRKASDLYERVLEQVEDDPEPRRLLAWIYQRLGHLEWSSDSLDGEPALRRSIAILEDLAKESRNSPDDRLARCWSHYWLAACLCSDLRFKEALPESQGSIALAEDLVTQFPANVEYGFALACGKWQLGQALEGVGELDEAEKHYRAALAGERPDRWVRVAACHKLCYLLMQLGRYDEAQPVLQEGLQIAQRELAPDALPGHRDFGKNLFRLALSHRLIGLHRFYSARLEEAERQLREAIGFFQRLSGVYPVDARVPVQLGIWYHDVAEVLTARGRLEEAEKAHQQSLAAWGSSVTAATATFSSGKGLAYYRLGELLHATGRTDEARQQFTLAQANMEDLARRRPEESACHWQLICLLANCPDESLRDPPRAIVLAKQVLPEQAGHYWRYLALAQYRSQQWQAAADSIQRAMDLRQGGDAFDWFLLAMAHRQLDQKDAALESYTKAQEAIRTAKPLFYEYLGVMAVQRLQREAETLIDE